MKKRMAFRHALLMALLSIFGISYANAQNTQIRISGIRSDKGQVILNVFKNNDSYNNEESYKRFIFPKKGILNGVLVVKCTLDPGIYGITMIDDENGNGKIDKNMIRMPKEGFGFSNFYLEKMKKPTFDDFKTEIKSNNKIEIKTKYM